MTQPIIIQTTVDNQAWADKLIASLVESRLSADVQLSDIHSYYWWDGAVQNKKETLLTIKTREDLISDVENTIRQHSEYQVPQIIVIPIIGGGADYLNWINTETKKVE